MLSAPWSTFTVEKSGQYKSVGTIATNRIKALHQELSLYFVATPMESNRHLWPDDYSPKHDAPSPALSASAASYSAAVGLLDSSQSRRTRWSASLLHNGVVYLAEVVDHIIPHRGDMKLFWDPNNWQGLTKADHDCKTALGTIRTSTVKTKNPTGK